MAYEAPTRAGIAGFFGGELGNAVAPAKTTTGAYAGDVLGFAGGVIGTAIGPEGSFAGAFAGKVVGDELGDAAAQPVGPTSPISYQNALMQRFGYLPNRSGVARESGSLIDFSYSNDSAVL